MLKILLPILTVVAVMGQTAASAATIEQDAVTAGEHEASYNRARFICVANGIPMPTYEEKYGLELVKTNARWKSSYPDFYALGATKGVDQSDEFFSLRGSRVDKCIFFMKR